MSLDTFAIIVGVDNYPFAPLRSAVNDALAVRDELTSPGRDGGPPIVPVDEVILLVSPHAGHSVPAGSAPATRRAILDALKLHYESPTARGRLIFYFAGHGMTASRDGRVRESLILPADVASVGDGEQMICIDDLLGLFSERGPLEQIWLVDACRDMPYERRPRGYEIGWQDEPYQGPRGQGAIHAVAAGGKALSAQGGHGRFTSLLLQGLRGEGSANEFVPGRGHCVTPPSLASYVQRHVRSSLKGWDLWTQTVQVPETMWRGPALSPLRDVPSPPLREFSVNVEPPEARPAIAVTLEVQEGLQATGWPPKAPARLYELRAALKAGMENQGWGQPRPRRRPVDLREETDAVVEVPRADGQNTLPAAGGRAEVSQAEAGVTTGEHGISRAAVHREAAASAVATLDDPAAIASTTATLHVKAADVQARVELRMAQHPFTVFEGALPNRDLTVAPGAWDVQVLLGDEVISAARLLLAPGERGVVSAVAQITPAAAEVLRPHVTATNERPPETVRPSETIGPMQGAVLPTLLPLLALKPFDYQADLLHQMQYLNIPLHGSSPVTNGAAPRRSVAVALDGGFEPGQHASVSGATPVWASDSQRLSVHTFEGEPTGGCVDILVPGLRYSVAAPGLAGGVTAISLITWPSGTSQVSIGIYRLPIGRAWDRPGVDVGMRYPPGRIARAIAVATPWFRAGASFDGLEGDELMHIAYGKWLDPILGLIAFHAMRQSRRADMLTGGAGFGMLGVVQSNLARAFGDLPDCRIVGAVRDDPLAQQAAMLPLLGNESLGQPVLTASLALLAEAARRASLSNHWSIERFDRIEPGQVFNVVITTA